MSNSRNNDATIADIDRSKLISAGAFKNVYAGTYTRGPRAGQKCVAKEFKTGSVFEKHYFEQEMNIIRRTQQVIDNWHKAKIVDKRILLNTPEIWMYCESLALMLVEPMIEKFEKFNSNTGWAPVTGGVWSEAMQALSHFSYHDSNGQILLCDVQGGAYRDGYILSDPVIMSQKPEKYGPTDLGPNGIRLFFYRHRCGRFCNREWKAPTFVGGPLIPMRRGTSMISLSHLPSRSSRSFLTQIPE
ncbi:kinase-like domain-containing protein [Xylaria curta]|nr:kinase-like domain-containing protein [Xylaria curta]